MIKVLTDERRRESGLTLTELLVVATILAVLTAIAVPAYNSYRRRGFVAEADGMLQALVTAEKTYRQRRAAFWTDTNPTVTAAATRENLGVNILEAKDFDFKIETTTGPDTVTVTATGKSGGPADVKRSCTYSTATAETTCQSLPTS